MSFLSNFLVLIIFFALYPIVINIELIERSLSNPLSNKSIVVGLLGHCPNLFWAVDQIGSLQYGYGFLLTALHTYSPTRSHLEDSRQSDINKTLPVEANASNPKKNITLGS